MESTLFNLSLESTPKMQSSLPDTPVTTAAPSLVVNDALHQETLRQASACCSLAKCPLHRAMWGMSAAAVFFAALGVAYLIGVTNQSTTAANWQFPATVDAAAAVSSEKYSMATGLVGDEAEGLFVLDHNSGLLQCSVMYPRVGQFLGLFTINVGDALGTGGKGGTYIMVTGHADFPRASNRPIASTLVYVLNTATGNFAAYGIPFDRTQVNSGRPQQGQLIPMGTGQANPVIDRDALR